MSQRPQTLAEVAQRGEDLRSFGGEFQDWLHAIRSIRTQDSIQHAIREEPDFLKTRFPEGINADAWLAAYAEHAAQKAGIEIPHWTRSQARTLDRPWFSVDAPAERLLALRDSPLAFKNRNLFTPRVDLPLNQRAGRPPVSAEPKRQKNAGRQRRFRARRAAELAALRASAQS